MFVCCECCVLSGRGLCDGLIIRPEESYRLWRVVECDQETSNTTRLKPATGLWKIQPQWFVTPGKQTNKQFNKLCIPVRRWKWENFYERMQYVKKSNVKITFVDCLVAEVMPFNSNINFGKEHFLKLFSLTKNNCKCFDD